MAYPNSKTNMSECSGESPTAGGIGLAGACRLVVEAQVEGVGDVHRAVLREVTVEAYRVGSQCVGGKRKPYSVGIDLAECVKGVEGHRPDGGGIDGEPGVDVG